MQGKDTQEDTRAVWRGLLILNGALLAILAAVTFGNPADAQMRPRGEYTMVAGQANGAQGGVVFLVDSVNEELVAITYDTNARNIAGIGYRNLAIDAANLGAVSDR